MLSKPRAASRLAQIEPFQVMRILEAAKTLEAQGRDVIHLEVGEPDFPTPPTIVQAGIEAMTAGHTFYTPATGLPALRDAIARFHEERFGVQIDPRRIIVTPGASGALQLILALLVGRDDEVLLADPGYPCNRHLISLFEGRPVTIPVGADTRFQLNAGHVAQHACARSVAALVASPANPTGTVLEPAEIAALAQACRERGMALIVDEIYQGLVYDRPHETALSVVDDAFVVNSFSKFFQMTGWRLGWLIAPEWAVPDLEKLAQNLFLAPPTIAQHAALAAFSDKTLALLDNRRLELDNRRRHLYRLISDMGLTVPCIPQGAFYLWVDFSRFTDNAEAFAQRLLHTEGVAITPGSDFGGNPAFVRLAYTQSVQRLEAACERLGRSFRGSCT
ncbi:aminotransferase class I/II-fold pyridoxal phosphate-dependent enzyme [Chitiniphilus eburneus]|uniref:Putative 8-amino-7-oxononanoate synthase n=1 Tax=Chitiniphilus eburneus TaxID=2571148 RepID=A0A4U0QBZ1_9NEIS|nr:aminotransferase class I/II-fold pyridoxal phosphate-dependent enzyme [Chitiniphilus eburneus]TJZ78907.1 aminotransferase class I/II-fold pyridoxal phosphate-dependent enzyme [Chitiniphilus eburneus]